MKTILTIMVLVFVFSMLVFEDKKKKKTKRRNTSRRLTFEEKMKKPIELPSKREPEKPRYNRAELKAKGEEYEKAVGLIFEGRGYKVTYRGLEMGKKDGGIDLIAQNDKETILIQCKNWSAYGISHKQIKEFLWNCQVHLEKTKYSGNVKFLYVLSGKINRSATGYISVQQSEGKPIDYEIIKF